MVLNQLGERIETSRDGELKDALNSIGQLVPPRFIRTFILIECHGYTWRQRAEEIGVSPAAIGYQLRQVKAAIERFREAEAN